MAASKRSREVGENAEEPKISLQWIGSESLEVNEHRDLKCGWSKFQRKGAKRQKNSRLRCEI